MKPETFARVFEDNILETYSHWGPGRQEVELQDGTPVQLMYPGLLLITSTPTHLCAELVGALSSPPTELKVAYRRLPSIGYYLGAFPGESAAPVLKIKGEAVVEGVGDRFSGITFFSSRDEAAMTRRYPELRQLNTTGLFSPLVGETDVFNAFVYERYKSNLWLSDILLLNSSAQTLRARYFQFAALIRGGTSSTELEDLLLKRREQEEDLRLFPVITASQQPALYEAAAIATFSSVDIARETTITAFLEQASKVLLTALGGLRLIAQPSLPWLERNTEFEEDSIQPDFLLVDSANNVHICEVKLPLLGTTSLTTGGHRRRRFKSPIAEGVAQLANYNEYFHLAENARFVEQTYGVKVEHPRLILLIGSQENFDAEEVRQASRAMQEFELVDYDTLRARFVLAAGIHPARQG